MSDRFLVLLPVLQKCELDSADNRLSFVTELRTRRSVIIGGFGEITLLHARIFITLENQGRLTNEFAAMNMALGIDTGGTYTDAVLVENASKTVIAKSKSLTTRHNLIEGVAASIGKTLGDRTATDIKLVCLSTTLATNSIVEGHGAKAALILMGYRSSQLSLANLDEATRDMPVIMIDGGHDASGQENCPLDVDAAVQKVVELGGSVSAVAISGMFSVRNPSHEIALRDKLQEVTGMPVTCGHELSASLDAPRRALTALINARLIPLIKNLIVATRKTMKEHKINAPLMVVRGDGTLVSSDFAEQSPVETILSGPAASVVGAQFLADRPNMLVSDIGGTTTDVAVIKAGQPLLSSEGASVNGWRTMVKAVKIDTHGLGGDSEILFNREQREFTIGPHKVMPLCVLANKYPEVLNDLKTFIDQPWTKTNMARFIVLLAEPDESMRLTNQQRALVDEVKNHPQSMQSVFAERHFSLAMKRLIEMGILTLAGFTPTDAAHVCGWQKDWPSEASLLGATLLSRYSEFNLGRAWSDPKDFSESMLAQMSRQSALCLMTAMVNDVEGAFGKALNPAYAKLLERMFARNDDSWLGMTAKLSVPVIGIGAPAQSFYPPIADFMEAEVLVPEHAEVANAVGAVVGVVRQSMQITISPIAGQKRVVVHAPQEQREFDDLETAAAWACDLARELASQKAIDAGGAGIKVEIDRRDNIVEEGGQVTFFESVIVATATGSVA